MVAVWGFAAPLVVAVVSGLVRKGGMTKWPSGALSWTVLVGFGALVLYAANTTRGALVASAMPEGVVIDLASPLGPGRYFIANGGAVPSINAHAAFLDRATSSHRLYWGTGHGVDIVALDRWGLHADGLVPVNPRRYTIFGRSVVPPCAGEVVAAIDGLPDMAVPRADHAHLAGNHVILRCAAADILLGHFHQGLVRVRVAEPLKVSDAIAQVGNLGNTSEPHLHIHAQRPGTVNAPFSEAPLSIRFDGRSLVRNDRFVVSAPGART